MTNVYAWSTDPDSNDTIDPPIYWPEGQNPATVNNSARAMMAAVACLLRDTTGTLSAPGVNAYSLSLNQGIADYSQHFEVAFFVGATNSGPSTLAVNGLTPKRLLRRHGRDLGPGDLAAGVLYRAIYVGGLDAYTIVSPEIAAPGTIVMQGSTDVDPGWTLCDGTAVSRTAFAALFGRIGTTYGVGDGLTTFNLPDLRGRAPFGADAGASRLTGAGGLGGNLGSNGGAEAVTLAPDQMPSHSHTGTAQSGGGTDGGTTGSAGDHNHGGQVGVAGSHSHGLTIDQGGSHSHSGTANTAGGEARAFSFVAGGLTPGGQAQYVADINAGNVFENKRVTSTDPGHIHSVTIPQGGDHTHTGSVATAGDHQHGISGSGSHTHTLPPAAAHTHSLAIENAGGSQAHSNIPPGLVVLFVIKT